MYDLLQEFYCITFQCRNSAIIHEGKCLNPRVVVSFESLQDDFGIFHYFKNIMCLVQVSYPPTPLPPLPSIIIVLSRQMT